MTEKDLFAVIFDTRYNDKPKKRAKRFKYYYILERLKVKNVLINT